MTLHYNTPEVAVTGHFGAVKALRLLRAPKQASTPAKILASRTHLNFFTRTTTLYGARPLAGDVPDATSTATLGGQVLRLHTVDGDSTLTLSEAAGRALWSQNAQQTVSTVAYEPVMNGTDEVPLAGRPLSMSEQPAGDNGRIREQYSYAPANGAAWKEKNLAGSQIEIRHNAGINRQLRMSVTGQLQGSTERLLKPEADLPDWATTTEDDTEAALTCTATHDATGSPLTFTNAATVTTVTSYGISGAARQIRFRYLAKGVTEEAIVLREACYRADGVMLSQTAGNGIIDRYEYAPRAQYLTRHLTERPAGHAQGQLCISDLHYTYDPVGNIDELEDKGADPAWHSNLETTGLRKYSYDTLYRLGCASGRERTPVSHYYSRLAGHSYPTSASVWTPYTERYAYDDGDNLTTISHLGGTSSRTRLLEVALNSNRALVKGQEQDPASGFLPGGLQKRLADGRQLSWSDDNQLQQVILITRTNGEPSDIERYYYADGGTRVRKISAVNVSDNIQTTLTTYAAGCEVRQRLLSNKLFTQKHIVITEVGGARVVGDRISDETFLRYSFSDHLGNSCGETDGAGKVIAREEYSPFGDSVGNDEDVAEVNNLAQRTSHYSGKERDITGLYHYGWRYLQPGWARWLSADPAGLVDGLNLFRFVQNNPLKFFDTDGRMPKRARYDGQNSSPASKKPKLVTRRPQASSLPDIVLVYGMEPDRGKYLTSEKDSSTARLTIDDLNSALGLSEQSLTDPLLRQIESNAIPVTESAVAYVKNWAPRLEPSQVRRVLQSWSNQLHQHYEDLQPIRKIRGSTKRETNNNLKNLLLKNVSTPFALNLSTTPSFKIEIDQYLKEINSDRSHTGVGSNSGELIRSGTTNSFFRKTSKIGLDWAKDNPHLISMVEFITWGTGKSGETIDVTKEAFKTAAHKRNDALIYPEGTYYPITFSELRHIDKNNFTERRIKLITKTA